MKNKENKGKSGELLYTLCFKFGLHWNRSLNMDTTGQFVSVFQKLNFNCYYGYFWASGAFSASTTTSVG